MVHGRWRRGPAVPHRPSPLGRLGDGPLGRARGASKIDALVRSRLVRLNGEALDALKDDLALPATFRLQAPPLENYLHLPLFDDMDLMVKCDQVEAQGRVLTWVGHIEGEAYSEVTLVFVDGVVTGNINIPGKGLYEIRYLGRGLHTIAEIDPALLPPHAH
jgi:hypothetical protein